jgi:hypothetical protein
MILNKMTCGMNTHYIMKFGWFLMDELNFVWTV